MFRNMTVALVAVTLMANLDTAQAKGGEKDKPLDG